MAKTYRYDPDDQGYGNQSRQSAKALRRAKREAKRGRRTDKREIDDGVDEEENR